MSPVRILLADDHAIVRAGIRKVVEELPGVEVVAEVGSGPELMESLAQQAGEHSRPGDSPRPISQSGSGRYRHLDCILIDVRMPDFEPLEAISEIRARFPDLKILVVSAHNDSIYVQGLLAAGVNGYHLKDQPLSDLKLALERVLAGERWITSSLISRLIDPAQPGAISSLLTLRQKELLRLLREGHDNNSIAAEMGLSVKTVENHLTRLYRQLRVQSRLEAVTYLSQHPDILGVTGQEVSQEALGLETAEGSLNRGISILLVDDNVRYMRQLQHMLGKAYPRAMLYEAENIATAVQLAQRVNPRLVFVDVVLGEEDGIRCARRIKAISPQSRIITISAYPDREFHRLSLEAGAVAFLDKKDLDTVTLRQVIDDVVG
jgi:DNA-binding NarL/FixJ family response regulator